MTAAPGACFYRIRVPLEALAARGFDVTFIAAGDNSNTAYGEPARYGGGVKKRTEPVVLSSVEGYDLIIGHRLNRPSGMETWRRARGPFNRLVYETDDDVFSITPDNWPAYNLFRRTDILDAVEHSTEVADLVTVSTGPLAKVMGQFNPSTVVLPNCLPDWVLQLERKPHARPCLGWAGGASHGADVGLIVEPVRRFLDRFSGWDFRLGGTDFRPTFARSRIYHSRWVPINKDPRQFYASIRMDIGLAPLVPCTFANSKSFLKVLEYAGLGIPSVASATGPYPDFIRHGENGFLALSEADWLEYLSLLASDDALRGKLGAQAKADARNWTIGANWQLWADAYTGLFPKRPQRVSSGIS